MTAPASAASPEMVEGYEILVGGETVRDPKTGLEWLRCSLGQKWDGKTCAGKASEFTFDGAQEEAKAFNGRGGLSGKAEWRVPTVRELASLIYCSSGKTKESDDPKDGGPAITNRCDGDYLKPTIRQGAFPDTPPRKFWTSSPYVGGADYAWNVYFGGGNVYYLSRYYDYAVRLVRASQSLGGAAALGSGGSAGPTPAKAQSPAPKTANAAPPQGATPTVAPLPSPSSVDGYEILTGGEIVRDPKTGLEWMRCGLGQKWDRKSCSGKASEFTFDGAQEEAKAFNQRGGLGGKADWRVPTVRELASLIYCSSGKTKESDDPKDGGPAIANWCDGDYLKPTIRQGAFPDTPPRGFWTSSPYVGDAVNAWVVDFKYGGVYGYGRYDVVAVRLVRASQSLGGAAALGSGGSAGPTPAKAQPPASQPATHAEAQMPSKSEPAPETNAADPKSASDKNRVRPSPCSGLANGDAVRVPITGQPQPQSALVLAVSGAQVSVRVMGSSAAAGRKLNLPCSKVRKAR